jgi:RHS repeat-associated protein
VGLSDQEFDFGSLGQHQRGYEHSANITITQMGARPYLQGSGRFLSIDPVEGGTSNDYTYVDDPMNDFDIAGRLSWKSLKKAATGAAKFVWKHKDLIIAGPAIAGMIACSVCALIAGAGKALDALSAVSACASKAWGACALGAADIFVPFGPGKAAKNFRNYQKLTVASKAGIRTQAVRQSLNAAAHSYGVKAIKLERYASYAEKAFTAQDLFEGAKSARRFF